jgi:mono/diheme cytochrome c family protein
LALRLAAAAFVCALVCSVAVRAGGRSAPVAGPFVAGPAFSPGGSAVQDSFDTLVKPFLAEHCFACHGNQKQRKELNLESFTTAASLVEHGERWEMVAERLRAREMPPDDEPQPDDTVRQAVASWVARELARIDRETPPDPGRVTTRRLNRAEYNNTVRDLLGVDLRPADDFPQDDAGYGFDNIGDVLSLSPALMEKYMTAAERVTRAALFGPQSVQPTLVRLRSEGRRVREARTYPGEYDVTGLSLPNAFHAVHRVPLDGEYVIRVFLGGLRPAGSEPVTIALWIDDGELQTRVHDAERTAAFEIDRQDFNANTLDFRVKLAAGDRAIAVAIPRLFEGLPARYGGPNPSPRVLPPPEFRPPPNATPERIANARKRFDEAQLELAKIPMNGVRVNAVEVGGPYKHVSGPAPASLARIYTCGHTAGSHVPTCTRRIVRDFARRAFRRPVTAADVATYVRLAEDAQRDEGSFEEGLAVGLQAVLVSPDFLFRIERDRAGRGPAVPISQHELAARLSYFLWSSMPDAALRRAAEAGTLRQPAVLSAQVRRMLRDPRSRALAENFGGQWLQFRALESTTRDRERFPDFEDYLRQSMRRETMLFLEHIVRDDRSILDFIDGRYSFLNERLARHYGVGGVAGPAFRKVDLTGSPRAGVLTHASVLTVSSYATRTSPVLRGKWILENLLNAPPPEPPPDVPNLDEKAIGSAASLRAQLEEHRRNAICASCHRKMDPLGFGLENFDAVGAWRTMDGNFPIDASGSLPDGEEFTGPEELRRILREQDAAFARGLTAKLLTYALGRGLERYDTKTVRAIAGRLPAKGFRFSALVLEIVNSLPFQNRRAAVANTRSSTVVAQPLRAAEAPR